MFASFNSSPMFSTGVPLSAPSLQSPTLSSTGGITLQPAVGQTINVSGARITNLGAPSAPTDVANKSYVDTSYISTISGPLNFIPQYAVSGIQASPLEVDANGNLSGVATITPPAQLLTINSNTIIDGNLTVTGSTTTTSYSNVSTAASSIILNNGNTSSSPIPGSLVNVISVGIGISDIAVTALTIASPGNPPKITAAYTALWTPTQGDVVQITGSSDPNNNGLYEVNSATNDGINWFINIKGTNSLTPTYNLFGNNFITTVAEPACFVNVVKISVLMLDDAVPKWTYGINTSSFTTSGVMINTGSSSNIIPTSTSASSFTTAQTASSTIPTNALTISGAPSTLVTSIHNTNPASASATLRLGKNAAASSITWDIGADYMSNNTDELTIYHNVNATKPIIIDTNDVVHMLKASSPQYILTSSALNPGAGILWSNSGTLMYGSSIVASASGTTNALAVFSATSTLASPSTTTPATLSQPLNITTSVDNPLTISSSSNNPTLTLTTSSATNQSTISLGKTAWQLGTDTAGTNGDDFYIYRFGTNALSITEANQILTAGYGIHAPQYTFDTLGASPGSTILWYDGTRPQFGSNTFAYTSDIPTGTVSAISPSINSIVTFADVNGNIQPPNSPMLSTQPLIITAGAINNAMMSLTRASTNTTGFALQTQTASDINALYFNGYQDSTTGLVLYKPTKSRWAIINNADASNDRLTIETTTASTTTTAISIQATGIVTFPVGTILTNESFTAVASNPGSTNTVWYNSADSRLYIGANRIALTSDAPAITDTNPLTNNLVIYADTSANRKTANTTAVLNQAINITGTTALNSTSVPVINATLPAVTAVPAYLLSLTSSANSQVIAGLYNTSTGSASVQLQLGQTSTSGKQWSLLTDPAANGTDALAIKCGSNGTNPIHISNTNNILFTSTAASAAYTSLQINANTTNRNYVKIFNAGNSTSSTGSAIQIGSSTAFWEIGNDTTLNGAVNFYLNNGASNVQTWTAGGTSVTGTITASSTSTATGFTLTGQTTNPGSSTTLWYNTTDSSLYNGSNKIAYTSSLSTDTNPINNNLVVYSGTGGNRKTADADTTIGQTLIVNQSSNTVGWLRVRPNSDTAGNIVMQSFTGSLLGYSTISFNGNHNGVENRYNTSKQRWRVGVDQRSTADKFFIDRFPTSPLTPFTLDSTTTEVQLTWPLDVTRSTVTSGNATAATFASAVTNAGSGRVIINVTNSAANNSSAAIMLGKSFVGNTSLTWEFGVDNSANNTDNLFIRHNIAGTVPFIIGANDLITAATGHAAPRYDITPKVSNPGSTTTLWANSGDANRPYYGASKIAFASDLTTDTNPIANSLVIYTDISGNRGVPTTTVTCAQPLTITGAVTADSATITNAVNAGSAAITGAVTADSATITNAVNAGSAAITGAITAGSATVTNAVNAGSAAITGAITAGSATISGAASVTGNLSSGVLTVNGGTSGANLDCMTVTGSATNFVQMYFYNTASGRSGTGITFGQPLATGSRTWAFNTGSTTNDFWLWTRSGAVGVANTNQIYIDATTAAVAGVVQCPHGVMSKRYDLTTGTVNPGSTNTLWYNSASDASRPFFGANKLALFTDIAAPSTITLTATASNPGGATTIWADSTTSDSLRYGAGNVLVNPAPTTANAIPAYTGTGGQVSTASSTTFATLSRPLSITGSETGTNVMMELTANLTQRSYLHLTNNGTSRSTGIRFRNSTGNRWMIVCGNESGTDEPFSIFNYQGGGNTPLSINPLTHQTTLTSLTTARIDMITSGSNPGSTNTMWYNSASDALRHFFGANKLGLFVDIPNGNKQIFTTAGIFSVTLPSSTYGLTQMHVFIMGGGGGGGGSLNSDGGAGGGAAGAFHLFVQRINYSASYTIAIGAGGGGGTSAGGNGVSGSSSFFRIGGINCITVAGGAGGSGSGVGAGASGSMPGGGGGGNAAGTGGTCQLTSAFGVTFGNGVTGTNISPYTGGAGGFNYSNGGAGLSGAYDVFGGGGGGGPYGGAGGTDGSLAGSAGTFGCGGGGAGSSTNTPPNNGVGGAGGTGWAVVWYT